MFLCKAQSVGLDCSDRCGWLNPIFHVKIATLCATLPLQGALSVSAFQGSNCTHLFRLTLRKSTIKGGRQFPVHELVARCFCLGTFYSTLGIAVELDLRCSEDEATAPSLRGFRASEITCGGGCQAPAKAGTRSSRRRPDGSLAVVFPGAMACYSRRIQARSQRLAAPCCKDAIKMVGIGYIF